MTHITKFTLILDYLNLALINWTLVLSFVNSYLYSLHLSA